MKLNADGRLRFAARCAFAAGAVAYPTYLFAQEPTELQGVQVTGSHVRRVDTATSDTLQVLGRKEIQATGAATLGQLVQSIPAITGVVTNSVANNDPSAGASAFGNCDVNLRGLGNVRTLILVDGKRINYFIDICSIPANLVERVEVLKEGASAVYGTDAIGGVVNFITRKNFRGLEVSGEFGETEHGDAQTTDVELTYGARGHSGGNVMFGMNFNKQTGIQASDRPSSAQAWGWFNGKLSPNEGTSSITPGGFFAGANSSCAETLTPGAPSNLASSYTCFVSNHGFGPTSRFNFQPYNLDLDPSQRFSVFGSADLPVTDNIKWYSSGFFTDTKSSFTLAPTPFDSGGISGVFVGDNPTIAPSSENVFNPFNTAITTFRKRATAAGPRHAIGNSDAIQLSTGFKGTLLDRFDWDVGASYGVLDQSKTESGLLDFANIFDQIGPNFINSNGVVQCGSATSPIPLQQCTPINIFQQGGGPNSLAADAITVVTATRQNTAEVTADINGDLFTLPWAGPVGVAAGIEYRNIGLSTTPDATLQKFVDDEQNAKATAGGYSVREIYGETHIPLVKDLPGAKSLALNLGIRGAWYSSTQLGSVVDGKYAFEYRPYSDLLIRGSYNDVYRAPNVSELYGGASQSAPGYTDPCNALSAAALAQHANACKNVAVNASQLNPQATGVIIGNPALHAEKGYATDFGFVFNPEFYKPLTIEADYWRYSIKDFISTISLNEILDACFNNNGSPFCGNSPDGQPWFTRDNHGNVSNSQLLFLNSDRLYTSGYDFSVKLNYPKMSLNNIPLGSLQIGVDVTYLDMWRYTQFDPASGALLGIDSVAGHVEENGLGGGSGKYSPMPRTKGLIFIFWNYGDFSTTLEDRYIGSVMVDPSPGFSVGAGYANYVDVAETYHWKARGTDFTFGINDVGDHGIQPIYDTSHTGAPATIYDPRGRNFYGRVTVHFK